MVHNGWLDDFLITEHSPSDSVHVAILNILELLSSGVTGLVADHVVFFQVI
jgi:hypothetical protein